MENDYQRGGGSPLGNCHGIGSNVLHVAWPNMMGDPPQPPATPSAPPVVGGGGFFWQWAVSLERWAVLHEVRPYTVADFTINKCRRTISFARESWSKLRSPLTHLAVAEFLLTRHNPCKHGFCACFVRHFNYFNYFTQKDAYTSEGSWGVRIES